MYLLHILCKSLSFFIYIIFDTFIIDYLIITILYLPSWEPFDKSIYITLRFCQIFSVQRWKGCKWDKSMCVKDNMFKWYDKNVKEYIETEYSQKAFKYTFKLSNVLHIWHYISVNQYYVQHFHCLFDMMFGSFIVFITL